MNHREAVKWLVTFLLVPLAPLALAALFRQLRAEPASGSLWWCTEIPFFSTTLCAATFFRCREVGALKLRRKTTAQSLMPYLEVLLATDIILSLMALSLYYSDIYVAPYTANQRAQATVFMVILAIAAFVLALVCVAFEIRVHQAKAAKEKGS